MYFAPKNNIKIKLIVIKINENPNKVLVKFFLGLINETMRIIATGTNVNNLVIPAIPKKIPAKNSLFLIK